MARNTFATFGILAVLLLSVGLVSAVTVDNFELSIVGDGTSSSRLTGTNDSVHAITINVNNTNSTFGDVYVNWTVAAATNMELPAGEVISLDTPIEVSGFNFTIPYHSSSYVSLTAHIYNNSDKSVEYGTKGISIYYNNTDYAIVTVDPIPGCTDPTANNYNSSATEDDDSCIYDTTPSGYNFCEVAGKVGDLRIIDVDFSNLGEGEDEDWFLLDEIEIEVEIENTHNKDNVGDVLVEIKILDRDDNDMTKEFDFDDEEISLGTIKDDESETVTFRIKEIPADLDAGSNFRIYIRAYSEDAEDEQCVAEAPSKYLDKELYQEIDVTREDDPAVVVRFDDFKISTSCGAKNVEVPLSIYNLGEDKEDSVLITLQNHKLGINEQIIIDNLRSGRKKDISFFLDIPTEVSGTAFTLDVVTYYAFDEDEEADDETSYSENSADDLDKDFPIKLEITTCRGPAPGINANLDSAAKVGEELIVKTLVTNNGEDNDFVFSISNFESWAEIVSISPATASIKTGEFVEVMVVLRPNTAGTQSFMINTIVDGESYTQPVAVKITEDEGIFSGMSNMATYIIIAIIAVLVLIFLVLIAKVSRRPAKPQF